MSEYSITTINLKEALAQENNSYKELLKRKYEIEFTGDVNKAKKLFNSLESLNNTNFYEYNEEGKISGFYSKVMVDTLLDEFEFINITGDKDSNLIFKDGYYQKYSDLKRHIKTKLSQQDKHRMRNIKESMEELAIESRIDNDLVNADTNIINFRNGIYDINKRELLDHNSQFISTIQINTNYVNYDIISVKFQESLFNKYLNTSFNPELIPTIQEMFGYCLSSFTEAQKMFVLLGEGKNGKSVFISVLNAFFSKEFISSVELKDLCRHEFVARLHNKAINTCADISAEYMNGTGLLKQIIGEDRFEARPLYSNPFAFKNRAKMVFSGNELPSTNDKSYAFIRRLIILNCNKRISEEAKITDLAGKIISSEMELIASWAIEGLQRLIENNFEFSNCKELDDAIETYKLHNNSISSFITDFCIVASENEKYFIPKAEFMEMYKKYCVSENSKPLGSKNLNSTMNELKVYEKFHTLFKGRYWRGIAWNKNILEFCWKTELDGTFIDPGNEIEKEEVRPTKEPTLEEIETQIKELQNLQLKILQEKNIIDMEEFVNIKMKGVKVNIYDRD
jgi:putative DNA primase/helicase